MSLESEKAHDAYCRYSYSDGINTNSFEMLSKFILNEELTIRKSARIIANMSKNTEEFKSTLEFANLKRRLVIDKVLAAEFFPDDSPPQIVIAESELDLHDKLREKTPAEKPRISGDIIYWENLKFFMCDGFLLDTKTLYTETNKQYHEIANSLLDMGYIPVDAQFKLLPNYPISKI